jgi:O-antigen/teichoic acid export membrane protein
MGAEPVEGVRAEVIREGSERAKGFGDESLLEPKSAPEPSQGSDPSSSWQDRQHAGLRALMAIASTGVPESATTIIHGVPLWLPEPGATRPPSQQPDKARLRPEAAGQDEAAAARGGVSLLSDTLVRNSLALMLSYGLQAGLGFIFWIIMARLYSARDVGTAGSLMSATSLISFFALFGMNTALIRFLPTTKNGGPLITAALLLVAGGGAVISLAYVLLTPVLAPRLAFVAHHPAQAAGFILLSAAAAVNILTDSVFIAARKAGYATVTDGAIGGVSKIIIGVAVAGTGAYGLYTASVGGMATAAVASLILSATAFHWRPTTRGLLRALKPLLKFSGANYAANAFNLLPSVVLPLIVLDRLGAESAGYYFVAFQIASLLYAAIYAVESAVFAEGSQAGTDWRTIRRSSRRLAIGLFVPGGVALALASRWLLLAFGVTYSQHATAALELLAAAVLPMALLNWSETMLRLSGSLRALVLSTGVYSVAVCGAAWVLVGHGLAALSGAWFIGATCGAIVAAAAVGVLAINSRARHRKAAPGRLSAARR